MIGKELKDLGVLVEENGFMLVKKAVSEGEEIPKHNHPGNNIFFTVVKGKIEITLNDEEKHMMEPGKVLNFNGENYIQGLAKEDTEIFIYLIGR
ncbi:MAG: cupin domain-containing protein [Tissierellia bacterium]|nr:cupin domain-containing protein [Tissierellia bacterium]